MKRMLSIIIDIFALIFVMNSGALAGGRLTVVGTGDSIVDVANVQDAVNSEDVKVVVLNGTFDFGDYGSVTITKDISILGDEATILGGRDVFFLDNPEVDVVIKGIHFGRHTPDWPSGTRVDGAANSAIWILQARSAIIQNNVFRNARPLPTGIINAARGVLIGREGIWEGSCGTIMVSINDIDFGIYQDDDGNGTFDLVDPNAGVDPPINLTSGIDLWNCHDLKASILENTISNCTRTGIYSIDNFGRTDSGTSVTIANNEIACGPFAGVCPGFPPEPKGYMSMIIHSGLLNTDAAFHCRYKIIDNYMAVDEPHSYGLIVHVQYSLIKDNIIDLHSGVRGIWVLPDHCMIIDNDIYLASSNDIAVLFGYPAILCSNNVFSNNRVSGAAGFGLYLMRTQDSLFDHNDFCDFSAGLTTIYEDEYSGNNDFVNNKVVCEQ